MTYRIKFGRRQDHKSNESARFFVTAGVACIAFFLFLRAYEVHQMQSWPGIPGRVDSIELRPRRGRNWSINVRYTYVIGPQTIRGTRYGKWDPTVRINEGREIVARYQQDPSVTVYYNPKNLSDAVIHRDEGSVAPYIALGSPFALLALAFIVQWIRSRH